MYRVVCHVEDTVSYYDVMGTIKILVTISEWLSLRNRGMRLISVTEISKE